MASWLIFAALLLGRRVYGWRGRTAIYWTLAGFMSLLLAYVGVKFVLEVVLGRIAHLVRTFFRLPFPSLRTGSSSGAFSDSFSLCFQRLSGTTRVLKAGVRTALATGLRGRLGGPEARLFMGSCRA